jgi:hypothetical protein
LMSEYLIVADAIAPLVDSDPALHAVGLARALVAAKHKVNVLSLASPEHVARVSGMARRLRTVEVRIGEQAVQVPLFEGRTADGQAELHVLGYAASNRGQVCAVLASGAASLAKDGLLNPGVLVGWGDASAGALSSVQAGVRVLVLPTGQAATPLSTEERAALAPEQLDASLPTGTLLSLGATAANAIAVPSASAARAIERLPALAARPSDQPVGWLRFGCDEPPFDPTSDATLAQGYGAENPAGKAECRKALARRAAVALGPRTLLVATGPLVADRGGLLILECLARLARIEDVALVIPTSGEKALNDQANLLALAHPGKVALVSGSQTLDRQILAGADALLLADGRDVTGRTHGLALRYGTLPIAPDAGADGDYLVDFDPSSRTGTALLYSQPNAFEIEGAVRRALALRAQGDRWPALVSALMASAPRWSDTVARLEQLGEAATVEPVRAITP